MDERNLYRQLIAWLKAHHPGVLAQWESERRQLERQEGDKRLLRAPTPTGRLGPELDQLSPDANASTITKAIQRELESLGIGGGTPGTTPDGTPCVHLIKTGVYGTTYEESVTLARIRDLGYRRHLKQVFG